MARRGPHAQALTWSQPAGTPGALLSRSPADPLRLQTCKPGIGIEHRSACQPAVHHRLHPLDGQARLGNVGRQDHPAPHTASPPEYHVLRSSRHIAEQRENIQPRTRLRLDCLAHALDLAPPRQEHKDITIAAFERLAQCAQAGRCRVTWIGVLRHVDHVNRVLPAQGSDHRRLQQVCERLCIQCCRHHQQAQVFTQSGGNVQAKCQRQITDKTAFMKFIEDQQADAAQFRVILQTAQQQTLGQDLDPGGFRDLSLEAHLVADRAADLFAEQLRHAPCRHACSGPPGLEHQNAAPGQPLLVQQQQRDQRRLAGTRLSGQYRMPTQQR